MDVLFGPYCHTPLKLLSSMIVCAYAAISGRSEVLVIEGPKLATVKCQVKKLKVSVLVLGQKKIEFCSGLRSEEALPITPLPLFEKQDRGTFGTMHQSDGVLDNWSSKAEQRTE